MGPAFFKEASELVSIALPPKYDALAKLNAKDASSVAYRVIIQIRQIVIMAGHRAGGVKVSRATQEVHVPKMNLVQAITVPT